MLLYILLFTCESTCSRGSQCSRAYIIASHQALCGCHHVYKCSIVNELLLSIAMHWHSNVCSHTRLCNTAFSVCPTFSSCLRTALRLSFFRQFHFIIFSQLCFYYSRKKQCRERERGKKLHVLHNERRLNEARKF